MPFLCSPVHTERIKWENIAWGHLMWIKSNVFLHFEHILHHSNTNLYMLTPYLLCCCCLQNNMTTVALLRTHYYRNVRAYVCNIIYISVLRNNAFFIISRGFVLFFLFYYKKCRLILDFISIRTSKACICVRMYIYLKKKKCCGSRPLSPQHRTRHR